MSDLHVTLEPAELAAEPGGEATCRVRIRNESTRVEELTATVLGPARDWAIVEPGGVRLFPNTEDTVTVRFRPPRTHQVAPGAVVFGVRVVPQAAGEASSVVEEGTLVVGPFTEVVAVLRPRRSRGRLSGHHRLMVTNRGNVPTQARLAAADPDEQVRVRFRPEQVQPGPGDTEPVAVRVRPRRLRLLGAPLQQLPFEVAVDPTGAPRVSLPAAMDHQRLIPRWVLPALGIAAALLIAFLALRAHSAEPVSLAGTGVPGTGSQAGSSASNPGGGAAKQAAPPPAAPKTATPPKAGPPAVVAPPVAQQTRGVCWTGSPFIRRSLYTADGTTRDSLGGQDGTLLAGASYGPGETAKPPSQAFVLDGGQSAVDLGPAVGELGTANFCLSLDVKTTQQGPAALIGNRNTAGDGKWWNVRLSDTGQPYLELDNHGMNNQGPYLRVGSVRPINDGQWHNLSVLRVGTLVNLYVDQELVGSATSDVIDVANGARTEVGWDGFLGFTGAVDQILITRST
jgi:Concanavalin A-like lectin/glucanases superfamily